MPLTVKISWCQFLCWRCSRFYLRNEIPSPRSRHHLFALKCLLLHCCCYPQQSAQVCTLWILLICSLIQRHQRWAIGHVEVVSRDKERVLFLLFHCLISQLSPHLLYYLSHSTWALAYNSPPCYYLLLSSKKSPRTWVDLEKSGVLSSQSLF